MPTIDNLVIEIESNSADAERGLDNMAKALDRLRTFSSNQRGLNVVAKGIRSIADASNSLNMAGVQSLNEMTNALSRMGALNNIKLSSSFASQIKAIGDASRALSGVDFSPVSNLATSLAPLSGVGKATNLNNVVNTLRKLPDAINNINKIDSSKIKEFADKVEELRKAVHPLADEMRAVSAGFSSLPKNIQKAINANEKLTTSNNKTTNSFSRMLKQIFGFGAAYYAIKNVFGKIMDAFKESNAYVEALNLADITMGRHADGAKAYAEQVERLAGINQVEWLSNLGTLNQMFTGFGVGADQAAHMSQQLTQLAYDIQSAYNAADLTEVMRRLQSGITGEVEGMRRYGVDLTNASMQEYLHAKGIETKVSALSQAQKAMVRYNMIMESTSNIQGDLARTIATPANALRILSNQVSIAARYFGQLVSVIATAVIPIMQAVVKAIAFAAQALAALFGYTLPSISGGGGEIASGFDGVADSIGGVGGAASDAKKEMKGLLASFDEINVIQQEASSGGGGGGGGGGGINFDDFLLDPGYDFLAGLTEDENSLLNHFLELARAGEWNQLGYEIESSIISAIKSIDSTAIGQRIGLVLTVAAEFALGFLRNAASGIFDIGQEIGDIIQGLIDNTNWKAVFTLIGSALVIKFTGLPLFLAGVFSQIEWGTVFDDVLVTGILSGITGALEMVFESVTMLIQEQDWESIGQSVADSIFAIDFSTLIEDMNLSGLADAASQLVSTLFDTVTSLSDDAYLGLATITAVGGMLLGLFTGNWIPLIVGSLALIGPKIKEGIDAVIVWWNETAYPALSAFWDNVGEVWNASVAWVKDNVITPLGEWFSGLWDGIVEGVKTGWENVKLALGSVGEWFQTNIATPIVDLFVGAINGVIDAINRFLGWLNGLSIKLPSVTITAPGWTKELWGWSDVTIGGGTFDPFNFDLFSKIGAYEYGGFPEIGQLFIANEAGPELVGQMGNRTAVANTAQIVEGISVGVTQANVGVEQRIERLIRVGEAILAKENTVEIVPSAALGRLNKQSEKMRIKSDGR